MASEENGKNAKIYTVSVSSHLPEKKLSEGNKFWHINREMMRFKIHYFLFCGAFGSCLPYLTIFAQKRVGISATALAAMLSSQRVIFIFTKPSMGYIADYFNKLKGLICMLAMATTIFLFVLLSVPKIEGTTESLTLDHIEDNLTRYELFNTSEAYVVCDFHKNNRSQSVDSMLFNNGTEDNLCFESLQHLFDFLDQCPNSTKNDSVNETNNTKFKIILEQKLDHMSSLTKSFSCQVCCKSTEICHSIDCRDLKFGTKEISNEKKPISDFQTYQFWCFAIIATISLACGNSLFTLTDTACCESVQKTGADFGRQRLWGAIGWGILSPIAGLLNDYTGDFFASWGLMGIMSCLSILNITKLEMAKPMFSQNLLKDIKTVLSSKEFLAFKFCVLMNGVGTGIMWFYLVLFLTDIGGSRFLCGMVMFVQCFGGEIPLMFISGWAIKKIGHFNILTLSLTAYCIRFFWYSQLHNPWFVLPAELLHGFTYGLFYTNVASFAKLSSKPGTEATTQAVLFTAHEGIGVGIGCVVAGLGFDSIGGHRTFLYTSIYAACAVVLSIILHLLIRKQKSSISVTSPTKK